MDAFLRPARASDIGPLAALERAVFPADRLSRRSFARLLASPSAHIVVAEDSGGMAGYAVVLTRTGNRTARLYSIAAAPGRKGVGRPLLEAAERLAAEKGCDALRLEVRQDNDRAVKLYVAAGYRPIGRREGYYEDGAPALRYEKLVPAIHAADPGAPPGGNLP